MLYFIDGEVALIWGGQSAPRDQNFSHRPFDVWWGPRIATSRHGESGTREHQPETRGVASKRSEYHGFYGLDLVKVFCKVKAPCYSNYGRRSFPALASAYPLKKSSRYSGKREEYWYRV